MLLYRKMIIKGGSIMEVLLAIVSFMVVTLAFIGLLTTIVGVAIIIRLWKQYDMAYRVKYIFNELKYYYSKRFRA